MITAKAKYIFVHVPKTAGSTLDQVLNREANGRVYWLSGGAREAMARLARMPSQDALRYVLYAGHLPWGLHKVIPAPCQYLTMLRNPVDRLVSHYFHVLDEPGHHSYEQIVTGQMSLLDFVTSDISIELDNLQTRFVAGLEASDSTPINCCSQSLLHRALENIEQTFAAVGVQELFDESLVLFSDYLCWNHQPLYSAKRVNTARPHGRSIPQEVSNAILYRNQFDQRLHQWATEQIRASMDNAGREFESRVHCFRLLNSIH